MIKVLSIKEPYATLIKNGVKHIETRSWKTSYRGKLYIHASQAKITKIEKNNQELMKLFNEDELGYGKILCSCELVDCVEMTDEFIESVKQNHNEYVTGYYEVRRYAWILKNVEKIDNEIEVSGHLGIWNCDKI